MIRKPVSNLDKGSGANQLPSPGAKRVRIIVGIAAGAVLLIGAVIALVFLAVPYVRDFTERTNSSNNIEQLCLALGNHDDIHGGISPAIMSKEGRPLLSWRVAILPLLEHDSLYKQFKLDEPWDGPNNIRLLKLMPSVYRHRADPKFTNGLTHYRVFVGGGAMFEFNRNTRLGGLGKSKGDEIVISDGIHNTIMIVEAAEAVPWTKPDELEFDPNGPLPELGIPNRKYVLVGMADSNVLELEKAKLNPVMLKAAITANGGEVLPQKWWNK